MKKNDWYFLGLVSLYSGLFYQQVPGLNLLIFTIAYVLVILLKHKARMNRKLVSAAVLCVLAGTSVFLYGNLLSFLASIISIGIFSFLCFSRKNSVIASLLFSLYNLLFALFWIFVDGDKRWSALNQKKERNLMRKLGLTTIPIAVLLIFILLYRSANPVFGSMLDRIDLSFVSAEFIGFTLLGALIVYAIFSPRGIEKWHIYETKIPDTAVRRDAWDQYISTQSEYKLAIAVIALLNCLLLVVNMVDISYLFLGTEFPENLTFSEILHQGVNTLIFSIILAIVVVLIFFRGRLNYYENNKHLKSLTVIWLCLNLLMALLTVEKTNIYVSEYGLTYKRIGVYVYLLLTCLGLIYTLIKVFKVRSNWFLVRRLGWYFWGCLVLASFVPWNATIAQFNIDKYISEQKDIDFNYLYDLGPDVYPILLSHQNDITLNERSHLEKRTLQFVRSTEAKSWLSYNLNDAILSKDLKKMMPHEH